MNRTAQKPDSNLPLWTGRIMYYDPDMDFDRDNTERVDIMPAVYAADVVEATEILRQNHKIRHPNAKRVRFCEDEQGKVTPHVVP